MAIRPDDDELAVIETLNIQEEPEKQEQATDEMREMSEKYCITTGEVDPSLHPNIDQKVINDIYKKCQETDLNILLAGVTGSGKSSLAIALSGEEGGKFQEGSTLKHCTSKVISEKSKTMKNLRVWDSPGLYDGENRNKKYLSEIECVVKNFYPGDLMIFCIKAETRFVNGRGNQNLQALLKMKKKFGDKIFKHHTVIALTHVDTIMGRAWGKGKEYYQDRIEEYEAKIRDQLVKYVKLNRETAQNIKIFPIQHRHNGETLPDGTRWLSSFWFGCLNAIPDIVGKAKWLKYFEDRVKEKPDSNPDIAKNQFILTDTFIPKELLEMRRRYEKRGIILSIIGLLGGPLGLLAIPLGVWAGKKYGEHRYLEDKSKAPPKK